MAYYVPPMITPLRSHPASRRRRRRTRGQALVEFALVIPVFFLVLAGIMDFGYLLYSRMTVINAAREGARAGAVIDATTIPAIVPSVVAGAAGGLSVSTNVVCVPIKSVGSCNFSSATSSKPGDGVKVTVTYTHHTFFPLLFGATIPLASTVQMVHE